MLKARQESKPTEVCTCQDTKYGVPLKRERESVSSRGGGGLCGEEAGGHPHTRPKAGKLPKSGKDAFDAVIGLQNGSFSLDSVVSSRILDPRIGRRLSPSKYFFR